MSRRFICFPSFSSFARSQISRKRPNDQAQPHERSECRLQRGLGGALIDRNDGRYQITLSKPSGLGATQRHRVPAQVGTPRLSCGWSIRTPSSLREVEHHVRQVIVHSIHADGTRLNSPLLKSHPFVQGDGVCVSDDYRERNVPHPS